MRHLHLIVNLGSLADLGEFERAAVDAAIRADHHIIFDDNGADLWEVDIFTVLIFNITGALLSDARPAFDGHIFADNCPVFDRNMAVNHASIPDLTFTNITKRTDMNIFPQFCFKMNIGGGMSWGGDFFYE